MSPYPLRRLDDRFLDVVRRGPGRVLRPLWSVSRWESSSRRPVWLRAVARRPGLVALAAAVVVFASSGVHLQRFETPLGATGADQVVADPGEAVAEVGPVRGSEIEAYVDRRRGALAAHPPDRRLRAVVSFRTFREATALELPDEVEPELLLIRLPLPDRSPRAVELGEQDPGAALAAVVAQERDELAEEAEELESMLDSDIGDELFVEEFERRRTEIGEVRAELRSGARVIYGVVVVGPARALTQLQDTPGVRLVDPGGEPVETRRTTFYGLLPDDEQHASHGRER